MKIVFTGGGTGGHFYPIIAVAQELRQLIYERKLIDIDMYFFSTTRYDIKALSDNGIIFKKTSSGKWRRYFSFLNFIDVIKLGWGTVEALFKLFFIYPDVVFSKGGYASMPTLIAARILGVPVFIHESDSKPGRANLWASKFAKRIAISYPEASAYFPEDITALTGNPVRRELQNPIPEGALKYLNLQENIPTILILGGSLGAKKINEVILEGLEQLVEDFQIIHQTGQNNFADIKARTEVILRNNPNANRYQPFPFLNNLGMRMAAGVASVVVSRAGSSIFEIALWKIPAIIIPIPENISHDQKTNAFTYARSGAGVVVEENNLSDSILISEIKRILKDENLIAKMKEAAEAFSKPEAAKDLASEIINLSLSHEI